MKSASSFIQMKGKGKKIAALTAYDSTFANAVAQAGCDTVLVGDSLGMVIQGKRGTQGVTVDDVSYHVECVAAGAPELHIMADLPFGSYETGPEQAFETAAELIASGAHMVKLEGGSEVAETVSYLVERGVPVCGHVGLLPQSALSSGMKVQGKDSAAAERIFQSAQAVSEAGAALIVLEMIPAALAERITAEVHAATIGIGAGTECDGQILVLYDVLGVYPNRPSFTKDFLAGSSSVAAALESYVAAVKSGDFPSREHTPA